jgi:hypothetical protein
MKIMSETPFTNRELTLMFEQIKAQLTGMREEFKDNLTNIREDIKQHNAQSERRFEVLEKEVKDIKVEIDDIKGFKTKVLTVWAIVIGAVTFLANHLLR